MSELPGNELERGASPGHADCPVMAGIVEAETLEPQGAEALTVGIPDLPAVQRAKDPLAGQHGGEMLGQKRPCPIRDSGQPVARPCLGASRTHLAGRGVNIGVHEAENGTHLDSSAIGECVDRSERQCGTLHKSEHIGQLKEVTAGFTGRRGGHLAERVRRQNADLA